MNQVSAEIDGKLLLEWLKFVAIVIAAIWAYYRFFRERTFAPNLHARLGMLLHGTQSDHFIVELQVRMENNGKVLIDLSTISAEVRGLRRDQKIPEHQDKFTLELPDVLYSAPSIVSLNTVFVEPEGRSMRRIFASIPTEYRFIFVQSRLRQVSGDSFVVFRLFDLDNPNKNDNFNDERNEQPQDDASPNLAGMVKKITGDKSE
ncbi:hypothetical protein ACVOMS_22635 [Bradyrhizobium guangxiense]